MKTTINTTCIILGILIYPVSVVSADLEIDAINYPELLGQIFSLQCSYIMKVTNSQVDNHIEITRIAPKSIMLSLSKFEEEAQIYEVVDGQLCGVEYKPQIRIEFTLQKGSGEATIIIWCAKVLICFEGKQYYFKSFLNKDLYKAFATELFGSEFWSSMGGHCN